MTDDSVLLQPRLGHVEKTKVAGCFFFHWRSEEVWKEERTQKSGFRGSMAQSPMSVVYIDPGSKRHVGVPVPSTLKPL